MIIKNLSGRTAHYVVAVVRNVVVVKIAVAVVVFVVAVGGTFYHFSACIDFVVDCWVGEVWRKPFEILPRPPRQVIELWRPPLKHLNWKGQRWGCCLGVREDRIRCRAKGISSCVPFPLKVNKHLVSFFDNIIMTI